MTAPARAAAPPAIAPWKYTLRFALEIGSLVALGVGALHVAGHEAAGWVAAIVVPVVAAMVWGAFGVPGDTRGRGTPPVRVPGWARVAIETGVLGAGAATLAGMERWEWFAVFAAALVVDHVGGGPGDGGAHGGDPRAGRPGSGFVRAFHGPSLSAAVRSGAAHPR